MQGNRTENHTENVVSFFKREKKDATDKDEAANASSMTDVMRRNQENKERMARERLKANQNVIKSYRLKNKT